MADENVPACVISSSDSISPNSSGKLKTLTGAVGLAVALTIGGGHVEEKTPLPRKTHYRKVMDGIAQASGSADDNTAVCKEFILDDGRKGIKGTCDFQFQEGGRSLFMLALDNADIATNGKATVELFSGTVAALEGNVVPRIRVTGEKNSVESVGDSQLVMRLNETQVVIQSSNGETVVSTTFQEPVIIKEGETINVDLVSGKTDDAMSCNVKVTGKSESMRSSALLAALASFLLARRKKRLKE